MGIAGMCWEREGGKGPRSCLLSLFFSLFIGCVIRHRGNGLL